MRKNIKLLSKNEIINIIKQNRHTIASYKVKKIGLFGSYVRNEQKILSDIDLFVEFDKTAFDKDMKGLFNNYLELTSYLEKLLGRKVDILTPISIETIRIKEVADEIKRTLVYV
ncbi:MAG: hypothetical protein DDT22_01255 [candidate division WS2 bacterium]|nr:hypothetical protein [Candidatus Lithacetigena glycinireducens]